MATVRLAEASVRITADVRDGEREAAAAGERFGRDFAAGADTGVGRLDIPAKLAKAVEDASARVAKARDAETVAAARVSTAEAQLAAAVESSESRVAQNIETAESRAASARDRGENAVGRVRSAEAQLEEVRSRGSASTAQVVAAEERLETAKRSAAAASGAIETAETKLTEARSAGSTVSDKVESAERKLETAKRTASAASAALESAELKLSSAHKDSADAAEKGTAAIDRFKTAFSDAGSKVASGGLLNLAPLLLPAIASIGSLVGALALIPAAAFAGGAALAALKIGTSGVTDTFKAFTAQQAAVGAGGAQMAAQQLASADSIINAQKGVSDAIRGVADAQRNSFASIIAAEQAVTNSVRGVADAERNSANSIISAQEAVQSAVQSEADAERNSASSIISATEAVASAKQAESNAEVTAAQNNVLALQTEQRAEESLTQAKASALRAQQALTEAKQSASRNLEDVKNRVIDDALAQRHAVDALANANTQLSAVLANPASNAHQREAAQLAVDEAKQHLAEISLSYQRSQEDAAKAAAAGVEGSKQVISAQDQLLASQRSLHDAAVSLGDAQAKVTQTQIAGQQAVQAAMQRVGDTQRALTNAQITGAEQVANAQQKILDTQRALNIAQINGAESVTKAQEAVANAERALNTARINGGEQVAKAQEGVASAQRALTLAIAQSAAAAASGVGSMNAFNTALAKLAPNAQDFVRQVIALNPAFTAMKLDVQQRLFAGLGGEIRRMGATDLPVVRTGLGLMATSLNGVIKQATEFATSRAAVADYGTIFTNSAKAVDNFKAAIKPILQIFTDLAAVGSTFLPGLATGFAQAAQHAADFISHARETGKLHEFIQSGIDAFKELLKISGDIVAIFADITAHPPFGPSLLDLIRGMVAGLRFFLDYFPGATTLLELFIIGWRLFPIIKAVGTIIALIKEWEIVTKLAAAAQWLLNVALDANPLGLVVVAIAAVIAIGYLLITHWDDVKRIAGEVWSAVSGAVSAAWDAIVGVITGAVSAVGGAISGAWNAITGATSATWNAVSGAVSAAWNAITGVVSGAVNAVINAINGAWNAVQNATSNAWNAVSNAVGGAWNNVVNAVSNGVNNVINFVGGLPGRILGALGNIGSLLFNAGASLVTGFLDGIVANWDRIVSYVQSGMTQLRALWPFSPAKTGPFSGTGYVTYSGAALTRDFGDSILKGIPGVVAAARQLAQATVDAGRVDLTTALPAGGIAGTAGMQALLATIQATADAAIPAQRQSSVSVVQNIYNPSMQDATDSSNRELRQFAALGGFR